MEHQLRREDIYLRNMKQIYALIHYVQRAALDALNEYQKDKLLNLTTKQGIVMSTLLRLTRQNEGCVTLGCLARELHMSPSAASHIIDALENLNLVTRSAHDDDRRSICITLSATGRQCANAARQGILRAIAAVTAQLTPEENELRIRMTDKIYHAAFPTAE